MPSLTDYLAKNYLNASSTGDRDSSDMRPAKKRKKNKHTSNESASTLMIADDEAGLLLSSKDRNDDAENEYDRPLTFDTKVRSAEFRKSKENTWRSITDGTSRSGKATSSGKLNDGTVLVEEEEEEDDDDDEADALLRETIATTERSRAALELENAPTIVETEDASTLRMESGARAGIQTAADTAQLVAEQEAKEEAETRKKKKKNKSRSSPEPEQETIYRDATGRRIDLTLRRQEARKAELAKLAAEKKAREDAMGEVQLREREDRKQELEDAKFLTLSRGVDDEEMNDRLKEEVRWDDPMAAYMANKRAEENAVEMSKSGGARGSKGAAQKPRRREYIGAAPPNRYGIKPGWRWDGVDRGNGFEKEWFQARGKKTRNENLEYQWQMDE